jgi:hypothetical protein
VAADNARSGAVDALQAMLMIPATTKSDDMMELQSTADRCSSVG